MAFKGLAMSGIDTLTLCLDIPYIERVVRNSTVARDAILSQMDAKSCFVGDDADKTITKIKHDLPEIKTKFPLPKRLKKLNLTDPKPSLDDPDVRQTELLPFLPSPKFLKKAKFSIFFNFS